MTGMVWTMTSPLQWVAGTTKTVAVPQNAKLQRITNTSPPHFFSALLILAFDQYHRYDDCDDLYFCVTYYGLGTIKGMVDFTSLLYKAAESQKIVLCIEVCGRTILLEKLQPKALFDSHHVVLSWKQAKLWPTS